MMMMWKRFVLAFLFCVALTYGHAQVQHSGWLANFSTFKLSDKFSLHFDGQFRSSDRLEHLQTVLLRTGLNYHLTKKISLTAGYAYIPGRRTIQNESGYLAEHRIWQQAIYAYKIKTVSVQHRFRFEERYLPIATLHNNDLETDGYNHAYRFRYFLRNILPLVKGQTFTQGPFFALQNEVFLNTGDKSAVNGKTFDQNRLYLAFGYRLPGKIDLEAGYMNQYSNTRNYFTNNHIAQLAVYKRL
ncbi:DUF2490 domain-containing protein [Paraflavisolibacter sp. H34]|uniref:DUF2490 domain-containing protein n=1 Tax=Huijunlia imazamoxiresistens TaxID=3127457 RepID=UPI0030195C3F